MYTMTEWTACYTGFFQRSHEFNQALWHDLFALCASWDNRDSFIELFEKKQTYYTDYIQVYSTVESRCLVIEPKKQPSCGYCSSVPCRFVVASGLLEFCFLWDRQMDQHESFRQRLESDYAITLKKSPATNLLFATSCEAEDRLLHDALYPQTLGELDAWRKRLLPLCFSATDSIHLEKVVECLRKLIIQKLRKSWYAGLMLSVNQNPIRLNSDVLHIILHHYMDQTVFAWLD